MVYSEHVSRAEASAEEADDRGQRSPPSAGSAEEAEDNQRACHHRRHIATLGSCSHAKECKEGEDVWHNYDKICYRKAEHRGEVFPQSCVSGAIASNLRHRVLKKDINTYNNDKNTAYNAQYVAVLLNLCLHNGKEEVGDNSHKRIGTSHA